MLKWLVFILLLISSNQLMAQYPACTKGIDLNYPSQHYMEEGTVQPIFLCDTCNGYQVILTHFSDDSVPSFEGGTRFTRLDDSIIRIERLKNEKRTYSKFYNKLMPKDIGYKRTNRKGTIIKKYNYTESYKCDSCVIELNKEDSSRTCINYIVKKGDTTYTSMNKAIFNKNGLLIESWRSMSMWNKTCDWNRVSKIGISKYEYVDANTKIVSYSKLIPDYFITSGLTETNKIKTTKYCNDQGQIISVVSELLLSNNKHEVKYFYNDEICEAIEYWYFGILKNRLEVTQF